MAHSFCVIQLFANLNNRLMDEQENSLAYKRLDLFDKIYQPMEFHKIFHIL